MDLLRVQLISGEEVTLSADDFVNLVERPGFLSVTALKQPPSWADPYKTSKFSRASDEFKIDFGLKNSKSIAVQPHS